MSTIQMSQRMTRLAAHQLVLAAWFMYVRGISLQASACVSAADTKRLGKKPVGGGIKKKGTCGRGIEVCFASSVQLPPFFLRTIQLLLVLLKKQRNPQRWP
jgi:hypothetical protein